MHPEQKDFCQRVKDRYPHYFTGTRVLDVGSMDINGNNRYLFTDVDYTGIDIGEGPNVDIVCSGHLYCAKPYDVVISTEMLEHNEKWKETLLNMIRLTKPGGLLLFTCATHGRLEHGTEVCAPECSPHTLSYYRNLGSKDMETVCNWGEQFQDHAFEINHTTHDLYFWGIK